MLLYMLLLTPFRRVSKGDSFFISIVVMNTTEAIWGPDGKDFK